MTRGGFMVRTRSGFEMQIRGGFGMRMLGGFAMRMSGGLLMRTGGGFDANTHKHSGLTFVTPAQRHDGRDVLILRHRKQVYEAAKQRHPERWSGTTRDWKLKGEVWLNPERNQTEALRKAA